MCCADGVCTHCGASILCSMCGESKNDSLHLVKTEDCSPCYRPEMHHEFVTNHEGE